MKNNIGEKYDKIAEWWHQYHHDSDYGIKQIERAISYCTKRKTALDVGCGSGGRIIRKLEINGFKVTGIDVSSKMIELAKDNHVSTKFILADISTWETKKKYDLIVAWDSIFHLPLSMHSKVISKLCGMLQKNGILAYTLGDDHGEHESDWHNEKFYYSTIGIKGNLKVIMESNCEVRHLELDQFPEKHVFVIAKKM
ncbi:MAG TPA: methyltransferase domain-containing protein [Anditalea sp.]|nr:methyltransferase domain-containing protein [Anditalea sp.]